MTEPTGTTVKLAGCHIVAVKADMLKGTVRISFETRLDEPMLRAKRYLAILAADDQAVDLTIDEYQMRLPTLGVHVIGGLGEK